MTSVLSAVRGLTVVRRDALASVPVDDRLTYPTALVGSSLGTLPPAWHHVDRSWPLPDGSFDTAAACVLSWAMLRGGGLVVESPVPRAVAGTVVRQGFPIGPWVVVAPCRVVALVDEPQARGFAYGTVPGHPLRGEESFVVRREGSRTWLETRSFSRYGLVPLVSRLQSRTVARFAAAVGRACA